MSSASKQDTHVNFRAMDGPTDHESRHLFSQGETTFGDQYAALTETQAQASDEADETNDALVAQNETPPKAHTPEAREREENAALAKMNVRANLTPTVSGIQLFIGLLTIMVAGPVMLGIEYTLFFEMFSGLFENGFGELTQEDSRRARTWSLQAVVAVLAIKLWAVRAKRVEFLTGVAFVAAIAFVIGAVLKHANTQFLRDTAHSGGGGISWDTLPTDLPAATALFGAELTAPLLGLGFLIVPIVSAVLIGWSWAQIKEAFEGLAKARMFRRSYANAKKARRASVKADRDVANLETRQTAVVTAPLNELTNEYHANVRHEKSRIKKQRRRARTNGPAGNGKHSVNETALAKAEAAADETLKHLGNGFVKNQHAAWLAERNGSPP